MNHADKVNRRATDPAAIKPAKPFPYKGIISVGEKALEWRETAGGEIKFKWQRGDKKNIASLSDLKLSRLEELQLVRKILKHYRPHAIPDRNGYYAASVGVADDGKMMVDVNNELHIRHPFAGRGCSETGMLRTTQKDKNTPFVQFRRVYLMSGVATKMPDGSLHDKHPGHVACLCGECRQNLRDHTQNATFIMVPTGDEPKELSLNSAATSADQLNTGEAWDISHALMYPLPEYKELPIASREVIKKAYSFILDASAPASALNVGLADVQDVINPDGATVTIPIADYQRLLQAYKSADLSIKALHDHPTLENINRSMMQLIKKAHQQHAYKMREGRNLEISVVLVRTNNGDFYPGMTVNGELWLPTKPPEMPTALANAYNDSGISEVYMMTYNDAQIRSEMDHWSKGGQLGHACKMPDPAALGRLLKNLLPSDNPNITILPPNDTTLTAAQLMELAHVVNARKSFGPDFSNPKRTMAETVSLERHDGRSSAPGQGH